MKKRVAIIAALMLVMMGVSVSGSIVSSDWTITNMTTSTQTDFVYPVKVSTQALLDSSIIGATGLKWEVVDGAGNEVPFAPSPSETTVEGCSLNTTDDGADCIDAGTGDVALLPATGADLTAGNYFAFGAHVQFTRLEIEISTAGQFNTDPDITWEYCSTVSTSCTVWSPLVNVTDGTQGFSVAGTNTVTWDIVPAMLESDETGALPESFWVRARVATTVLDADYITQPLADIVRYEPGFAWVFPCDPCDDSDASFAGDSLAKNESKTVEAHLGMTATRTQHRLVPSTDGITHAGTSNSTGDYSVEIVASFRPTQTGAVRYIWQHGAATDYIRWDDATTGAIDVLFSHTTNDCTITDAASGITGDRLHTIRVAVDPGNQCELFVDGASIATDDMTGGASANNFASTWEWGADASVNYLERMSYDEGNLTITAPDIEFENQDLSTFTPVFLDNQGTEGATNDATPTFPLWTANLVGTATAFLPPTVVGQGADVQQPDVLGQISPLDNFVATPAAITLPGNEAVTALTTISGATIPTIAVWIIIGAIATVATIIFGFKFTQNIVLTTIITGAVMAVFVSLTIFSMWQVFVFAVIAAAVIMVGKGIVSSV